MIIVAATAVVVPSAVVVLLTPLLELPPFFPVRTTIVLFAPVGISPDWQLFANISRFVTSLSVPSVSTMSKLTLSVHFARSFGFVLPSVELTTTPRK